MAVIERLGRRLSWRWSGEAGTPDGSFARLCDGELRMPYSCVPIYPDSELRYYVIVGS